MWLCHSNRRLLQRCEWGGRCEWDGAVNGTTLGRRCGHDEEALPCTCTLEVISYRHHLHDLAWHDAVKGAAPEAERRRAEGVGAARLAGAQLPEVLSCPWDAISPELELNCHCSLAPRGPTVHAATLARAADAHPHARVGRPHPRGPQRASAQALRRFTQRRTDTQAVNIPHPAQDAWCAAGGCGRRGGSVSAAASCPQQMQQPLAPVLLRLRERRATSLGAQLDGRPGVQEHSDADFVSGADGEVQRASALGPIRLRVNVLRQRPERRR
eukprot:scaffold3051_cov112-Isochrysis_galbana.AAC.3